MKSPGSPIRTTVRGIVEDIDDPEERGRIKVSSTQVIQDGTPLPQWARPIFPNAAAGSGWFMLPVAKSSVEFDYVSGYRGSALPTVTAQDPRWFGQWYRKKSDIPEVLRSKGYGERFGIVTPKGSVVLFDEKTGNACFYGKELTYIGKDEDGQPAVVGDDYKSWMETVLDSLKALALEIQTLSTAEAAHTHTDSVGGVTGPPTTAGAWASLGAQAGTTSTDMINQKHDIPNHLSENVMVSKEA